MKPFIVAFILFGIGFSALFYWGIGLSFPIPGNEPLLDSDIQRTELAESIFHFLSLPFPRRISHGPATAAYGGLIWTAVLSLAAAIIWNLGKKSNHRA